MNVRVTAVCCTFKRKNSVEQTGKSFLNSKTEGTSGARDSLDLEHLSKACWNAHLKRSRSLEPIYCTIRLPPMVYDTVYVVANCVASVRSSGVVNVLGSGSVEAMMDISQAVRQMLTRHIRSSLSAERKAQIYEEEQFWGEAVRSLGLHSTAIDGKLNSTSPCETVPAMDLDVFTEPSTVFARAGIYPVPSVLRNIRNQVILEAGVSSEATLAEVKEELPVPVGIRARIHRKRNRDNLEEGTVHLNVVGDEALKWIRSFVSGQETHGGVEVVAEELLASEFVPSSYTQHCLSRIRSRITECRVQRLRRAGVQLQFMWCCDAVGPNAEPESSLASSGLEYFAGLESVALQEELHSSCPAGGDATVPVVPHHAPEYHKVDCILFSTGIGQIVSKNMSIIKDVMQLVIIPLLVIQAEI